MNRSVAGTCSAETTAGSLRYDWLFSRRADLAMIAIPTLATAVAYVMAWRLGENVSGKAGTYLLWASAFLLGNTSHVILTFLMLGARRDLLRATDRQARTVVGGSIVVFAIVLLLNRLTWNDPTTHVLLGTTVAVFAIHHTLSQAKGFWALYSLRGARAGLPAPSPRERKLQGLFVPTGLLLVAIKWTLVGESSVIHAPYLNVNPGYPAVLPYALTYGLVGGWLVYVAVLFGALVSYEALNMPKLVYLGTQCSVVTLELVSPGWGAATAAGIHGLEYYLLTRRMLAPTASESGSKLTSALCWPAMIAAMSPILYVGANANPWLSVHLFGGNAGMWAVMLVNATVLAHYYADAFIYRFRIPGIRKVALTRLGLS
jgi:hypothetical protein